MNDNRFDILKDHKVKNNRGRKWTKIEENTEKNIESSSDESVESDISSRSSDSFEQLDEDVIDVDIDSLVNSAQLTSESTNRLAVMHFDFDQYPLSHLANIIKHALPKNGKIRTITKYPSEEYMERYHDDIKYGPKEYLKPQNSSVTDDKVESNIYWKYQLSRLKFFYAIFEFDSIETSDAIYTELNERILSDSGLKLDLRYVDNDRKFEIPDEFLHLVEKLRPNFSKFKALNYKINCLSQTSVKNVWDNAPMKEQINKRAFEVTDNELSDDDNYTRDDTASEYSSSEAESNVDSDDNEAPRIKRFRRQRIPIEDYKALLGIKADETNETEEEEMELEEEVHSIQESNSGSEHETSSEPDDYIIDENIDQDSEITDSEDDENKTDELAKKKQSNKTSQREKMRLALKDKANKKKTKLQEIREYLATMATDDDCYNEFLYEPRLFKIDQIHPKYENAKLFLEMMNLAAVNLGISVDFIVPPISDGKCRNAGNNKKRSAVESHSETINKNIKIDK